MAIIQTLWATGQAAVPQAFTSGAMVAYKATLTIPVGKSITKDDLVEFAVLPADHELVSVLVIPEGNFAAVTANIGLMDGRVGDADSARTLGNEIHEDVGLGSITSITPSSVFTEIQRSDADRSIGLQFTDDVIGSGQKLTLLLQMYQ